METKDKPRIVRIVILSLGGSYVAWHCSDARRYAIGPTPRDAYDTWAGVAYGVSF